MLVIPAIDIIDGQCVRLTKGEYSTKKVYAKDPVKIAQEFERKGAEMLHIVDLDGAKSGEPKNMETVLKIRGALKIPIQIGGGIRDSESAKTYLESGIDRIIIGTKAIADMGFLSELITKFGSEWIVVSVDVKDGRVATHGWQDTAEKDYLSFAEELRALGVSEMIFTDVARDGTLTKPNLQPLKELVSLGFNVIAAGGVSDKESIEQLKEIGCYGAIIGKALYEGKVDLEECLEVARVPNDLAKRIIACMDIKDGKVVKGTNYTNLRDAGDPVELGKLYSDMGIDELVFLDITATIEGRRTLYELVERIAENINIPFTVGGGVKTLEDVRELLRRGADKVSIGSAAVRDPGLIRAAAQTFGSQCIVISIDPKRHGQSWNVYVNGGRLKTPTNAIEFAQAMERAGAGELLVNSLDRDGMKTGYDIELLRAIAAKVNIPIIASSGAGTKEHFLEAFTRGRADAALAASLFHFRELSISELKKYLAKNNLKIRI